MHSFTTGVVTDEIDQDLERACDVAVELGMRVVEINSLWGGPSDRLTPADVARAREIVGQRGLRIDAIGTLALKALELQQHPHLARSAEFAEHLETIRRAAFVAHALGASSDQPAVRIFSFRRESMKDLGNPSPIHADGGGLPEATLARIAEGLTMACDVARAEGVLLYLENVRSCWANTGLHTARILKAVDRPELRVIWDVANDFVSCGQSYHEGYDATRPHIACVHIKDARIVHRPTGLTAWTAVGEGEVDIRGQLAALARDGCTAPLLLETHWRGEGMSSEQSSRTSFAGLVAAMQHVAGG